MSWIESGDSVQPIISLAKTRAAERNGSPSSRGQKAGETGGGRKGGEGRAEAKCQDWSMAAVEREAQGDQGGAGGLAEQAGHGDDPR